MQNLFEKTRRITMVWLLAAAVAGSWSPVVAQDSPGEGPPSSSANDRDKLPPIADQVKDMKEVPGYFKLWHDERRDRLYMEIPRSMLDKDFLLSTSLSAGPVAGMQAGDTLLRFERADNQALLIQPNTFYTASGDLRDIVRVSYPDTVLTSVKILGESGGAILIDLKGLLSGQANELVGRIPPATITNVAKAKSFETNTLVELHFRGKSGTTGVYFNMGALPAPGYKPRIADNRVGYFLTAQKDFSKDAREQTVFNRYINRWHLEKQDNSLRMSPPKEPIVIYIEKTVPVKYRRWIKEGIEDWNKAFEKVGIIGAIEVRQQTDTNQFKDFDPEDARYNFFRWITSERAFAVAPSRTDPRTGQVLDSDILFDEAMVRHFIDEFRLFTDTAPDPTALSPRMRHWLALNPWEHPDWKNLQVEYSMRIQSEPALAGMTPEALFAQEMMGSSESTYHQQFCSIGYGISQEMAFAGLNRSWSLLNAAEGEDGEGEGEGEKGPGNEERKSMLDEWPEEFIGPIIKQIVSHEFGHTLGLRHNFKASSWKTYEEVMNATDPTVPTSASVMDYNAHVIRPDGKVPEIFITPTIGPYDEWAIEYGYAIPGTGDYPRNEAEMLKKIASRSAEPGLDYGTDEDVASPDPLTVRWDMGKDSLAYYSARVAVADMIMKDLLGLVVGENESWDRAREAFYILMSQRLFAARAAAKYVGGYHVRRDNKGTPDSRPPIEVVSAEDQKAAMGLIVKVLFAEDAIDIDPEIMQHLAASRWMHRDSLDWSEPLTFPIQDVILRYQTNVLFQLLNPESVQFLYDAELHVAGDKEIYTLPEMMRTLTDSIWAEVDSKNRLGNRYSTRSPMISNLRRNLQRAYLGRLITIATEGENSSYPAVARTMAWRELKTLGNRIGDIAGDSRAAQLDPYSQAHLEESKMRIDQALEAVYTIGGSGGGGTSIILMLGGQEPQDGAAMNAPNLLSSPRGRGGY
jgi:hypothetical protein